MAGGNKSNSPKSKKRKSQAQAAMVRAAQEKKSRWSRGSDRTSS